VFELLFTAVLIFVFLICRRRRSESKIKEEIRPNVKDADGGIDQGAGFGQDGYGIPDKRGQL
jgi:hypothetical protein